uniref:GH10590p n=1 Tax=Drosophila melanogaster TaxID=7227 RepID=Q8SXB8_DROME|nr:GH10590p [Drosophila melanogaster]
MRRVIKRNKLPTYTKHISKTLKKYNLRNLYKKQNTKQLKIFLKNMQTTFARCQRNLLRSS